MFVAFVITARALKKEHFASFVVSVTHKTGGFHFEMNKQRLATIYDRASSPRTRSEKIETNKA